MTILSENRPLLDAFRAGGAEALTAVYRHYFADIELLIRHGFFAHGALRVAGATDRETQRELIQEVFARAFAEPARLAYDGLRPYRPYLRQVAKNILIDLARRQGRQVPLSTDGEEEGAVDALMLENAAHVAEPPRNPEQSAAWGQLLGATKGFLAGLDEEIRTFVTLRFEEEKAQEEVAALMGLSRRRVRTLESRALEGLRKHLKKSGF